MSSKMTDDQRKRVAAYATILNGVTPDEQDRPAVFHHYLNGFAIELLFGTAAPAADAVAAAPSRYPLCDAEVAKPGFGTSIKAQLVPLAFAHDLEDQLRSAMAAAAEAEADAAAVRKERNQLDVKLSALLRQPQVPDQYADLLAAIRDGKTVEWASNPSTGPWLKCPVNKSDLGKAVNEVFVDKRIHYRIVEPTAPPYAGPPAAVVAEREAVASLTEDARQYRLRLLRYRAAKADGWRFTEYPHAPKCWYVTDNKTGVVLMKRTFNTEWDACWQTTPDYPHDASAVAAAVARLPQKKQERFGKLLSLKLTKQDGTMDYKSYLVLAAATAPAAVLCEAYVEAAERSKSVV